MTLSSMLHGQRRTDDVDPPPINPPESDPPGPAEREDREAPDPFKHFPVDPDDVIEGDPQRPL